jgi:sporulation protein YlmC with PRC-barrel domain
MATPEVHLERLVGRCVHDAAGRSVGRIEEVIAGQNGGEWVIREYLVGRDAFLTRLSALGIGRPFLKFFGAGIHPGYRIPWDKLNLTDPKKPRLECPADELETLRAQPKKRG